MKKSFTFLLVLTLLSGIFMPTAKAQITVSGSNSKDGTYTSLTKAAGAFAALNSASQAEKTIEVTITSDVTDEDGVTALTGAAGMWSTLTINPGGARTISGSVAKPLINLYQADRVTIDGLNTGGNSLTITNASTAATAGTSTIQFIYDATDNIVRNCTIKGSLMVPLGTAGGGGGILLFGAGLSTGNDGNLIENNIITNSGGSKPVCAIYSYGTSDAIQNSGNTINNNTFYDLFNRGIISAHLFIYKYSTDWLVTGNTFYEASTIVPTGTFNYYVIRIENTTAGNNFTVSGNYIGGSAVDHTGKFTVNSATGHSFYGIRMSVQTATPSSVQNNTIQNIDYTSSSATPFYGIYTIDNGSVNIGTVAGNTIGSTTGVGSITVTNSTANATSFGIYNIGTGILDIEKNNIGSITTVGSATLAHSFYAIRSAAGTNTISNNTIGSTATPNSINASSTSSSNGQSVYGINAGSTGTTTISENTIANLTNASTAGSGEISGINSSDGTRIITNNTVRDLTIANSNAESVSGIYFWSNVAAAQTVTGNTIYNLSNTHPSFAGKLTGLFYQGPLTASTVSGNFIHSLSVMGASSIGASIYGIRIGQGYATYSNNIISLGGDTKTTIYGINETGAASTNNNLYFNTVYIGGTPASGSTNKSYALYSSVTTNTRNFRNNIFSNVRSTAGGAGLHYAAWLNYTVSTNLTLDYNDYYAPGTGGVLGRYNNLDVLTLPIITGFDANSSPANPNFVTPGGTTAANYLPRSLALVAATGTGINTDYDGGPNRSATKPAMGAYEYTVNGNLVTVTASAGTVSAVYTRLKAAFDAIDAGTHKGVISIAINSSITETASAVLHKTGYNSTSDYSAVHIYPTVSGLTIFGNLPSPLIDLNGANKINIDGRVGGTGSTKDLIISNLSPSAIAGTSTIRFINDASTNTVQYCTIKGSSINAGAGVLFFSTGTATGNDGNLINNNNITNAADAGRPVNAVYSLGITGTALENSGNTISNNNIFDFFSRSLASSAISLSSYNTAWNITGNSFYETTSFGPTANNGYNVISVNTSTGNEFNISNNYIGGSSASCGGSAWTKTAGKYNAFNGIYFNTGLGTFSNIQGNTISNINYSNAYNSSSVNWYGINVYAGNVNIGTTVGNIIGSSSGTGSVYFTTGGSVTSFYAMNLRSSDYPAFLNVQNNTIAGITVAHSLPTDYCRFYGIATSGDGTISISNNMVGSATVANSIYANSISSVAGKEQQVCGIINSGTGTITISGNTVANLRNGTTNISATTYGNIIGIYSTDGKNTISNNTVHDLAISNLSQGLLSNMPVIGISLFANLIALAQTITQNTIYSLSNDNETFAGIVTGIYFSGSSTPSTVSRNFIYGLSVHANTTNAKINGIKSNSGTATYSNNIINLGGNTQTTIYGLFENGGTTSHNNSLYFNTVYIGGEPISGSRQSYALYSDILDNMRNFRNNIFFNARSNSGSADGKHFAIYLNYLNNTQLTIDNNDYWTTGNGGMLGFHKSSYLAANDISTLAGWKASTSTTTGKDVNSLSTPPSFASPGGITATNYIPANALAGVSGTAITTDYAGTIRSATPTMGAYERSFLVTWTGNTNSDWNTAGNWSPVAVPSASTNVIIPATVTDPVVSEDPAFPAVCNSLTINAGGLLSVAAGKALTVNDILTNSGNTGSLELLSNENGTGSLLHNTNDVPATVNQYITGNSELNTHVFHFVSIPAQVVNPTAELFLGSYLYKLDVTLQEATNSNYYGKWVGLGTSTASPLSLNQGYMIYYPGASKVYSFSANLNNGDFSCALAGHAGTYSYNLCPNPYPSAVNWGAAAGWEKSAGIGGSCYIWSATSGNYITLPTGVTNYIPLGQAFIAMVYDEESPTLTVKNAARAHSTQAFYKSTLNISNQLSIKADVNSYSDVTLVAFNADATEDFDLKTDGIKMYGLDDAPQLYTLTADKKYSINSLPEPDGYKSVPLNFETTFAGDVTLAFEGIESFPSTLALKLEDKLTSHIINLRQQPTYTFVHQPANASDRFVLHFGSATGTDEPVSNSNIWISEKTVNISSPASVGEKALVEIYNAGGQCVFSRQITLTELTKVPANLSGFAIVRVSTGKNMWVAKGVF